MQEICASTSIGLVTVTSYARWYGRLISFSNRFPPGYLDTKGLVYAALKAYNSAIILTSITPFGQSGPYHDDKGLDTEFSRGKRTKRDVRVLNDRKPWRGGT